MCARARPGTVFGVAGVAGARATGATDIAFRLAGTASATWGTAQGASAVEWQETDAAPNTWIWLNPTADLTGGQMYQATITLQGTGDVYLDFFNGQEDLTTETVQLTPAPVTLTLDGEVPSDYATPLQVRTADAGPVDLYASGASIQLLTLEASG